MPRATYAAVAPRGTTALVGYYVSRATAEAGYRHARRRYPDIGRLTRTVTPVSLGRHTVYALRLSAGSATNARTVCRYLHSVGVSCSVE